MPFSRRSRLAALAAVATMPLLATALPAHALVGTTSGTTDYTFTARLDIGDGDRACSGALVAPRWIVTAASCFTEDPGTSLAVPPGKPARATTATIGRPDLTSAGGAVRDVVELVPRADRDLVLARLARPVHTITPVAVGDTPPAAGEELTVTGYGRTAEEWAPLTMHAGAFTVDTAPTGTDVNLTGKDGAAVCKGDTGGPALRVTAGTPELVAVNSRSWQGGCWGSTETRTGAVDVRVDDLTTWIEGVVTAAPVTDFNCDGERDIAVADPTATVGTRADAGLVRVSYGGGKGTAEITEGSGGVPGGPEDGDRFGETLDVVDYDLDGCTDLVVGSWHENLDGATDAGRVIVVYGSRDGLAKGKAGTSLRQGAGSGALANGVAEDGDHFGVDVAAGTTTEGDPYIVIGAPREDYRGIVDAGIAYYVRGSKSVLLAQDRAGYSGRLEKGDRFGATVAASAEHIAIGAPTESVGTREGAGMVQVLSHPQSAGAVPPAVLGFGQNHAVLNGLAETDDHFGNALAMVSYRPTGSPAATDSILAVGVPGEKIGRAHPGGGCVLILRIAADGSVTKWHSFTQDTANVEGAVEDNDHFGHRLTAVNTMPDSVSTPQTLRLAVGVQHENLNGMADAGAVHLFSLMGAPGDTDDLVSAGMYGIPGQPGAGQKMGSSIHLTGTGLYVGMPYGPSRFGALYDVPWTNITDRAATQPVTVHQPGSGGFPAEGNTFGTDAR